MCIYVLMCVFRVSDIKSKRNAVLFAPFLLDLFWIVFCCCFIFLLVCLHFCINACTYAYIHTCIHMYMWRRLPACFCKIVFSGISSVNASFFIVVFDTSPDSCDIYVPLHISCTSDRSLGIVSWFCCMHLWLMYSAYANCIYVFIHFHHLYTYKAHSGYLNKGI